jgi:hypothetical protein
MKEKSNWVIDEEGSIWQYTEIDRETTETEFGNWTSSWLARKLIMTGFESPSCIWARKVNDHINDIYPQED